MASTAGSSSGLGTSGSSSNTFQQLADEDLNASNNWPIMYAHTTMSLGGAESIPEPNTTADTSSAHAHAQEFHAPPHPHGSSSATWNHNHNHGSGHVQVPLPYTSASDYMPGPAPAPVPYGQHENGGMTPDQGTYYEYMQPPVHAPAGPPPMPVPYGYHSSPHVAVTTAPGHVQAFAHDHSHGHPPVQHEYEYQFYARPSPPPPMPTHQQHSSSSHPLLPFTYGYTPAPAAQMMPMPGVSGLGPEPAHVYRRKSMDLAPFLYNTGIGTTWNRSIGPETSGFASPLDLSLHRESQEGMIKGEAWLGSLPLPPRQDQETQTEHPETSPQKQEFVAAVARVADKKSDEIQVQASPQPEPTTSSTSESAAAFGGMAPAPSPAPTDVIQAQGSDAVSAPAKRRKSIDDRDVMDVHAQPVHAGVIFKTCESEAPAMATAMAEPCTTAVTVTVPPSTAPADGSLQCPNCEKVLTSRNAFVQHIRHAHPTKKSPPSIAQVQGLEPASASEVELKPQPAANAGATGTSNHEPMSTTVITEEGPNANASSGITGKQTVLSLEVDGDTSGNSGSSEYLHLTNARHQPRIVLQKVSLTPPKFNVNVKTSLPSPSEIMPATPAPQANGETKPETLDKRGRAARHRKRDRSRSPSSSSPLSSLLPTAPTKAPKSSPSGEKQSKPNVSPIPSNEPQMVNGSGSPLRRRSLSKLRQKCTLCGATASTMSNLRRHYRKHHPKAKLPSTDDLLRARDALLKPGPVLAAQLQPVDRDTTPETEPEPEPTLRLQVRRIPEEMPGFHRIREEHARAAVGAVTVTHEAQEGEVREMPILAPCDQPFVELDMELACNGPVEEVEAYPPLLRCEVNEDEDKDSSHSNESAAISPLDSIREVRIVIKDVVRSRLPASGPGLTPCPICTVEYPTAEVNRHKYTHELQCHVCLRDDVPVAEMAEHGITHVRSLRCELCNYQATRKQRMWEHFNRHANVKPIICMVCGEGFYSKDNMRGHHVRKHLGRKETYPCRRCGMRFSTRSQRVKHERKGHKSNRLLVSATKSLPAAVEAAAKSTPAPAQASALKQGDVNNNNNRKNGSNTSAPNTTATTNGNGVLNESVCILCGKELSSRRSLVRHQFLIHGVTPKPKPPPQPAAIGEAETEADIPPAPAAKSNAQKPIMDNFKPKAYNLAYPRRSGSSKTPRACSQCGRVLSSGSALRRHQAAVHDKDNRQVDVVPCAKANNHANQCKTCDLCSQVLSSYHSLQRHLVLIHNKRVLNYSKILRENRTSWRKKRPVKAKSKRPQAAKAEEPARVTAEAQED